MPLVEGFMEGRSRARMSEGEEPEELVVDHECANVRVGPAYERRRVQEATPARRTKRGSASSWACQAISMVCGLTLLFQSLAPLVGSL